MKKIYLLLLFLPTVITFSCNKDFLDKAPGVDQTENDIFKNKAGIESFIPTIYAHAIPAMFPYREVMSLSVTRPIDAAPYNAYANIMYPLHMMADEADESGRTYSSGNRWNIGNVTAENILTTGDYRYYIRWISLRQINIMLNRINEVPDMSETEKQQIAGEMHTLRALNYLEMIKRYGGVPIIDSVFESGVVINKPRKTFEECIDFIVDECDKAINNPSLPASYNPSQIGRVTKLVAYCIKSKALLFAASPMFNRTSPVLEMTDPADNNLICYGSFNANRWQLAAAAAKDALDYALANDYKLVDEPENRDPNDIPGSGQPGPVGNYRYSWEINHNSEIILAYHPLPMRRSRTPVNCFVPIAMGGFSNSLTAPLNFIRKYEKKDGTPQNWDLGGGNDLLAKYAELDPRFKQTFCYTLSYFTGLFPVAQIFEGGAHAANCFGGVWVRKYFPRNGTEVAFVLNDVVFRLNEFYLDYAEALNEASSAPPLEAYKAVNTIRTRSAMPDFPTGLSKEQFRERIRNEMAVEMAYDNQRFFNIRRWLIAEDEGVMQGDFFGLKIKKITNTKFSWEPYVFERRAFFKKMYLDPFPIAEVIKGNLIQNPGY